MLAKLNDFIWSAPTSWLATLQRLGFGSCLLTTKGGNLFLVGGDLTPVCLKLFLDLFGLFMRGIRGGHRILIVSISFLYIYNITSIIFTFLSALFLWLFFALLFFLTLMLESCVFLFRFFGLTHWISSLRFRRFFTHLELLEGIGFLAFKFLISGHLFTWFFAIVEVKVSLVWFMLKVLFIG